MLASLLTVFIFYLPQHVDLPQPSRKELLSRHSTSGSINIYHWGENAIYNTGFDISLLLYLQDQHLRSKVKRKHVQFGQDRCILSPRRDR